MARTHGQSSGGMPGLLAGLCWGLLFPVISSRIGDDVPMLVVSFHTVFWAAVVAMALMTLAGQIDDLSMINRRSGALFLLVLSGGYGLWLMLSAAFHFQAETGPGVEAVFYSGPLLLIFLSMFTRRGVPRGRFRLSLAGFAGVLLLLFSVGALARPSGPALIFSLSAALCWALFSICTFSLPRTSRILSTLALTLSLSAICLFLTCLSMGLDVLAVSRTQMWTSMLLGVVPVAGGYGLWMKCMQVQPTPATAATWWYGAALSAALGYHVLNAMSINWISAVGFVLILISFRAGGTVREKTKYTFGDIAGRR